MKTKISIAINGKKVSAKEGQTILEVAREHNIAIPTVCFHPDLTPRANCRMCVVEVRESNKIDGHDSDGPEFRKSCETKVQDRMTIFTDSPAIKKERNKNLQSLFHKHKVECDDCIRRYKCPLLNLVKSQQKKISELVNQDVKGNISQVGPIVFDQTKCVGCHACIDICPVGYLKASGQADDSNATAIKVETTEREDIDCVYCGQCIVHCPVGAIEGVGEFEQARELIKEIQNSEKTSVVQFAPSIRASIGEEFVMKPGEVVTGQLVAGLRKLGFRRVFDTSVGADFTTVEETGEIIDCLKRKRNLPALTSCCPAWVKFVEFYYPEFIPNLATTRSPHILLGGLIKTYWAEQEGIDPKKVNVVSVMPCVSKKFEISRNELRINGIPPVDHVITTRELAHLFKSNRIDLKNIESEEADDPLGTPSGAGVIYGVTGGVFESALRTAHYMVTGENMKDANITKIRGADGIKRAEIMLGDMKLKVVVANGLANGRQCLEELKKDPNAFDAMEVMVCPGGCIGGGGQPIPVSEEIRVKRAESLYNIDARKDNRMAHENPSLQKIYNTYLKDPEKIHSICHTTYSQKKREEVLLLKDSKQTYDR